MTTATKTPAIFAAMAKVMKDLDAIGKDRENKQQGFKFRGIDQAYNAIHPLMAKHQIITVPRVLEMKARVDRPTRSGGLMTYTLLMVEYDFISGADGSKITVGPVLGEGADTGDKSSNKALAIAHKYVLFQTFLIPTEKSDDPDEFSHEVVPSTSPDPQFRKKVAKKKAAKKPAAAPAPVPDKLAVYIADAAEAEKVADLTISLAEGMHSGSVESLGDFRAKSKDTIMCLKENFPPQYERVRDAFLAIKTKLEE